MTPISRNLTVYKGITFTFFFILREELSVIDTFTSNATTDVITTATTHGLSAGDPVQFVNNGGALPATIETARDYFVLTTPTTSTFTFSSDYNGQRFDIQAVGTGTNTVYTKRPTDLTGWTIWAWVKTVAGGALQHDLAPVVASPTTGKVDLSKTDTETFAYTKGAFLWDLILENPSGERIGPLFSGSFTVIELITEPAL